MPNPFDQFDAAPAGPTRVPGGVFIPKPVDPTDPYKGPQAQATLTRTQQETGKTAAELPYAARKAAADTLKAEADAKKAQQEADQKPNADPALQASIEALGLENMLHNVQRARKLIGSTTTGIPGAISNLVPGSSRRDLEGALVAVKGHVMLDALKELKQASSTGASGLGALSEREGAMLASQIGSLDTGQSSEALLDSLGQIESHIRTLNAIKANKDPRRPEVQKEFGLAAPADTAPPSSGLTVAKPGSTTSMETDPTLAGANQHVFGMIQKGATAPEVRDYLNKLQPGLGDKAKGIDENIAAIQQGGQVAMPVVDRFEKPISGFNSQLNDAAQSAVGAGAIGVGDTLSMGTLDNMTANPEQARAGMAGVAAQHPVATLAGQAVGSAIPGVGIESILAPKLGMLGATIAGDVAPGVLYGAGSADDGSRTAGAAFGGLAGLVGGAAGRGAGRLVQGVTGAPRYLAQNGVRMTVPQILGGAAKTTEDRLTGLPLIGDLIQSQRRNGIEDFNKAAFNQALDPIGAKVGAIGETGVGQAQQAVGDAYSNALGGKSVQMDGPFAMDMAAAHQGAAAIPRVGPEVADTIAQTVPPYFDANNVLSGKNVQPLLQDLRKFRTGYRNDPLGNRVADSVQNAEGAVTGLFDRQAPDVMPQLNAANEAYSNLSPVMDSVLAAGNKDGVFMPSQLGAASIRNAKAFGGRNAAARGQRSLFDLQRAGQDVLPSTVPDSGTVGRWVIPGALGLGAAGGGVTGSEAAGGENSSEGAISGGGAGLAAAAVLSSPYLLRGVLQKALTADRPVILQTLGQLARQTRLPGALGVPLLTPNGN